MLEAGRVKPGEMVYDLGSGDGRVVITAVQKFGARAVGVELMPDLVRKARERVLAWDSPTGSPSSKAAPCAWT